MWNKLTLLFVIFLVHFFTYAQEDSTMVVKGRVVGGDENTPVEYAIVMAVRLSDSILLDFQRTDKQGNFAFFPPIDTFTLIVSHPKYDTRTFYVIGSEENRLIDIPTLKLYDKSEEFDELVIYAYKDPVHYRGDTLVYIADSFKVKPNAVVEDLLKKLPGMEVDKEGKIKVHGQEISKVLVDGDEFFGKDPTIATKNLQADAIETVEVYEKEDDEHIGSDAKINVLDLRLKEDAKKGYFGRLSLASDMGLEKTQKDPFYEGKLLFNKFSSTQKIAVFAVASNTPNRGLSWNEMDEFGIGETSEGRFIFNSGNESFRGGIPQSIRSGIYFTDKIGRQKKIKIGANYTFSNNQVVAVSNSKTQYFLSDTTYSTDDSVYTKKQTENHRINFTLETPLDSLTELRILPSFSLEKNDNYSDAQTQYIGINNTPFLQTTRRRSNPSEQIIFNVQARLIRKFNKPKRQAEIDYRIDNNESESHGDLYTRSLFMASPSLNDSVDQTKERKNSQSMHVLTGTYSEPIGNKWKTSGIYSYRNSHSSQDRASYDYDPITARYSIYRIDLSNDYQTQRTEHQMGLKLDFDTAKHDFSLRVDYRQMNIDNINRVNKQIIKQDIGSVLPSMRYSFRPTINKRFNISYNTFASAPSINDLQPVPDNSDPNRIRIGNPNLRPNYSHSFSFWMNSWNALSGGYLWGGIRASKEVNAFANSTEYNSFGQMTSQTVNVDDNSMASLRAGMGIPIQGRIIQLSPSLGASQTRYSNFINKQKNVTRQLSMDGGLAFSILLDAFEFEIRGEYSYYRPKNSLNSVGNKPFGEQTYGVDFYWELPLGFKIETYLTYRITDKRLQGYNVNALVWNMEIGKTLFASENLILSVVGNDLLNQDIEIARRVSDNAIVDDRTQIISRYFLLKITQKFKNRQKRQDDEHNQND